MIYKEIFSLKMMAIMSIILPTNAFAGNCDDLMGHGRHIVMRGERSTTNHKIDKAKSFLNSGAFETAKIEVVISKDQDGRFDFVNSGENYRAKFNKWGLNDYFESKYGSGKIVYKNTPQDDWLRVGFSFSTRYDVDMPKGMKDSEVSFSVLEKSKSRILNCDVDVYSIKYIKKYHLSNNGKPDYTVVEENSKYVPDIGYFISSEYKKYIESTGELLQSGGYEFVEFK